MRQNSGLGKIDRLLFVDVDDQAALDSIAAYHDQVKISGGAREQHSYPVVALKRLFNLAGEAAPEPITSSHQRSEKFPTAEVDRLLAQAQQRLAP